MRQNHCLSLLRDGRPAVGAWLQLLSLPAARLLGAQGLVDWLLVDFEHTPLDLGAAAGISSAIADVTASRVTPLARVADGSSAGIKQALDAGAQGVLIPMIRSAEEVREVVRSARFPPEGERGAGGLMPHLGFGVSRPEYVRRANREILVGAQIETVAALDDLDRILAVPGLDLCFIGPNDLHLALGCPAAFWSDDPVFLEAIERIQAACLRHRVPLGTLCKDAETARARLAEGFTFLGVGSDAHFLLTKSGEELGSLRGLAPSTSWCDRVSFED